MQERHVGKVLSSEARQSLGQTLPVRLPQLGRHLVEPSKHVPSPPRQGRGPATHLLPTHFSAPL